MALKIFIDGQEGTTGLKILDRFKTRNDVEILTIDEENRKEKEARLEKIEKADITFLCLPDEAAKEIAESINPKHRILDTSTAHRTNSDWTYGLPELNPEQRDRIKISNRVAVPGCHATGFILLVRPLIELGLTDKRYPFTCHSITGFSGGGKKMIAEYHAENRDIKWNSPRQYGLELKHKHLPEMTRMSQIEYSPIFHPIVADYFSGMQVTVPIHTRLLHKKITPKEFQLEISNYYKGQPMVHVMDYDQLPDDGFLSANEMADKDDVQIFVSGNVEQISLIARYDNLGKGASGAAIQCMNIMLGLSEETGLIKKEY